MMPTSSRGANIPPLLLEETLLLPRDREALNTIADSCARIADEYACVGGSSERQTSTKHGKSKEKEREKDKSKDKDKEKEKKKAKEKETSKEKEKSKEKAKEKEKDRDRGRDKGKGKGKEKERERDPSQHRRADSDDKESYSSRDDAEQEQQEPYLQDVHCKSPLRAQRAADQQWFLTDPRCTTSSHKWLSATAKSWYDIFMELLMTRCQLTLTSLSIERSVRKNYREWR